MLSRQNVVHVTLAIECYDLLEFFASSGGAFLPTGR